MPGKEELFSKLLFLINSPSATSGNRHQRHRPRPGRGHQSGSRKREVLSSGASIGRDITRGNGLRRERLLLESHKLQRRKHRSRRPTARPLPMASSWPKTHADRRRRHLSSRLRSNAHASRSGSRRLPPPRPIRSRPASPLSRRTVPPRRPERPRPRTPSRANHKFRFISLTGCVSLDAAETPKATGWGSRGALKTASSQQPASSKFRFALEKSHGRHPAVRRSDR